MEQHKMITIEGLTQQHVKLLDIMWSIYDIEVYDEWKSALSLELQDTVDVLEKLALYETLELELQDYTQANQVLKKFAL
jgi:hypothetical protein